MTLVLDQKIQCLYCTKLFTKPGMHTHVARVHGDPETKAKYSNGNNGRYKDLEYKKTVRDAILKRYDVFDEIRPCLYCSKEMILLNSSPQKFCTRSCSGKYWNHSRYGHLPPKIIKPPRKIYQTISRNCIICNAPYMVKEYNPKTTCSKTCARKHPNCGGKRNSKSIKYKGVNLDSTFELILAQSLDYQKIEWARPKHFYYKINDKIKRYYPDFYLPKYDIYLDPKNDYLIKIDSKKIKTVEQQNNIKIVVLNSDQLLWRHAVLEINKRLRGDRGC